MNIAKLTPTPNFDQSTFCGKKLYEMKRSELLSIIEFYCTSYSELQEMKAKHDLENFNAYVALSLKK